MQQERRVKGRIPEISRKKTNGWCEEAGEPALVTSKTVRRGKSLHKTCGEGDKNENCEGATALALPMV